MADAELWLIDLEKASTALETLEAETLRLSDADGVRIGRVTDPATRRERRLAHIALRILLERRCGPRIRRVPFAIGPSGKPSLPAGGASFSLSHSRAHALIALAGEGPLGVDLESMRKVRVPDDRRGPIEQAAVSLAGGAPLAGNDPDTLFLSAWVRIEAVAKANGTGVGPMLEQLRPRRMQAHAAIAQDRIPRIVAHDVAIAGGMFAAVALGPGIAPPPLRRVPERASAIAALLAS